MITSEQELEVAAASFNTWARSSINYPTFFLSSSSISLPSGNHLRPIELEGVGFDYRLMLKQALKELSKRGNHKWQLLLFAGTHVNTIALDKMLKELNTVDDRGGSARKAFVIGASDLKNFSCDFEFSQSKCSGFSLLLHRDIVNVLIKLWDKCVTSSIKSEEQFKCLFGDVEVEACSEDLHNTLAPLFCKSKENIRGLPLMMPPKIRFRREGEPELKLHMDVDSLDYDPFDDRTFKQSSELFNYPVVQGLSSMAELKTFHYQSRYKIRPVITQQDYTVKDIYYPQRKLAAKNCVNNPSQQLHQNYGLYLPECKDSRNENLSLISKDQFKNYLRNSRAYVLNLPGDEQRYQLVRSSFDKVGINLRSFQGVDGRFGIPEQYKEYYKNSTLKPGEVGYRESMRNLFEMAIKNNWDQVLVLDDDAIPHCEFESRLYNLFTQDRCFGAQATDPDSARVFLLGSAIWKQGSYPKPGSNLGGWRMVHADMKNHSDSTQCFNANNRTVGSFGVIYSRVSYRFILKWMDMNRSKPFDLVFSWLSDVGFVNRVAFPNLVIQDVAHKSRVDPSRLSDKIIRAAMHKWNLSDYCK